MKPTSWLFIVGILILVILAGCGGGGGSSGDATIAPSPSASQGNSQAPPDPANPDDPREPAVQTGNFIDSAVHGMAYAYGDVTSMTDEQGAFEYSGEVPVDFSVGDILLGSAAGDAIVTPVELVPGADDETHATVTNIARFLQTLDDDGDPENGIVITDAVHAMAEGESVNFQQSAADFADDGNVQTVVASLTGVTEAGARSLLSAADARAHLRATLLGLIAGQYLVSITADDSVVLTVGVGNDGALSVSCSARAASGGGRSGASCSASASAGGVQSSGHFEASMTANGEAIEVKGRIERDGTVSGQWQNTATGETGTFSGERQVTVTAVAELAETAVAEEAAEEAVASESSTETATDVARGGEASSEASGRASSGGAGQEEEEEEPEVAAPSPPASSSGGSSGSNARSGRDSSRSYHVCRSSGGRCSSSSSGRAFAP